MATGTGAHTTAQGGKPPFPPFESQTFASQLVSLAIALIALYLIVSRLVQPRVGGTIDARQARIAGDLAEAQKLKDEADSAIKTYEKELADARAKAQAIGSETREKLHAQTETERKALEGKLAAKLADAEKAISATRNAAMSNVKTIAADAAATLVQHLTGQTPNAAAVEAAVQSSLQNPLKG